MGPVRRTIGLGEVTARPVAKLLLLLGSGWALAPGETQAQQHSQPTINPAAMTTGVETTQELVRREVSDTARTSAWRSMLDRLADSTGGSVTLNALLRDRKGVLLEFWASWCEPCMKALPKLQERQPQRAARGVAIAGLNVEKDAAKAERVRRELGIRSPWLLDAREDSLQKQLGIDSIPRAVPVAADGRILFNGLPSSAALDFALDSLAGGPRRKMDL